MTLENYPTPVLESVGILLHCDESGRGITRFFGHIVSVDVSCLHRNACALLAAAQAAIGEAGALSRGRLKSPTAALAGGVAEPQGCSARAGTFTGPLL